MSIEQKEIIIVETLRYLFSILTRKSEAQLNKEIRKYPSLNRGKFITEKEAKNIINLMINCGFIQREGEPQGQMISIQPNGIRFLLDDDFRKKQIEIVNKQVNLAETQTEILNKMNRIYWIIAIATIVMAIATFILAIES